MSKRNITVAKWRKKFLRIVSDRELCPATVAEKCRISNELCRAIGNRKRLRRVRPVHIARAVAAVWKTGQQAKARRMLSVARDFFREAADNGYLDQNPALHVKPRSYRVRRARLSLKTWRRVQAALDAEPVAWRRCLALLALVTGQRRSDLAAMRFDDVWGGFLHIVQLKTGERIALPMDLRLNVIGLSLGEVIELCRGYAPAGATLLRKRGGGGALCVSSLSKSWSQAFHAANAWTRTDRTCPSLAEIRSLAARLYRKQGVDTKTLLGHRRESTTAIYLDDRGQGREAGEWRKLKLPRARVARGIHPRS
jgi:integrase